MTRLALQPRQTTGLVMTAELQQAIALLQLSNQELLAELTLRAESNPLLVVSPPEDEQPYDSDSRGDAPRDSDLPDDFTLDPLDADLSRWEDDALLRHGAHDSEDVSAFEPVAPDAPLLETIIAQIRLHFPLDSDRAIAMALLEALDEHGRLEVPPVALASSLDLPPARLDVIRLQMTAFDPPGCFTLSLAECLAAQFRARNRFDPAVATLLDHLDWLARGEHDRLRKACGLDEGDYADLLRELRECDPHPGAGLCASSRGDEDDMAAPDILVHMENGHPVVALNPATWPRLDIDDALYRRLLNGRADDRAYAQDKQAEARLLLRAVEQRARSLLLICRAVTHHQLAFITDGARALRPLTLAQIANATGLHESTVSRVTATRSMATPRGVLLLRRFFSTALGTEAEQTSADAIKSRIKQLIGAEDANAILSDDAVTAQLQESGIAIQRRTVAKYREALGIAGSAQRRRDYKLRARLTS